MDSNYVNMLNIFLTEARPLAVQCVDPPPVLKAVHQAEETGQPERDGRWGRLIDASVAAFTWTLLIRLNL